MLLNNDRVRENTSEHVNRNIDKQINDNIRKYSSQDPITIQTRIEQLDKESDLERALELASASNTLIGLTLGLTLNKKWIILNAVTADFLIQYTLQGWYPTHTSS